MLAILTTRNLVRYRAYHVTHPLQICLMNSNCDYSQLLISLFISYLTTLSTKTDANLSDTETRITTQWRKFQVDRPDTLHGF